MVSLVETCQKDVIPLLNILIHSRLVMYAVLGNGISSTVLRRTILLHPSFLLHLIAEHNVTVCTSCECCRNLGRKYRCQVRTRGFPRLMVLRSVTSLLSNIRYGRLTIHTSSATYDLPPSQIQKDLLEDRTSRELAASIHVRNVNFFLRVLLSGDLGFAESYMFGEVDIDPEDLVRLFLVSLIS